MGGPASQSQPFDVAVIGAGVVGCAVFRAMVLAGARTVLLEREEDICDGASKGNSTLLHTGFDAPPGTLEARLVADGRRLYRAVRERLGLPLEETGALVLAWTPEELARLPDIVRQAHANGVADTREVGPDEARRREPHLAPSALGAVVVPGEGAVDPWSTPLAYALQGIANGGKLRRGAEVVGGERADGRWRLRLAGGGTVEAGVVINCAGNHGDVVEAIARPSPFTLRPRKGQFVVYDKPARDLVRGVLLPVPTARTKGVVVAPTVFGNVLVGPTAEDQDDRRSAPVDRQALTALVAEGARIVPALADEEVVTCYAGLRPATEHKDYQIEALTGERWITVSGIRSTGLTSALGIAEHVRELHDAHFGGREALRAIVWPKVPNLAECAPRPADLPGRTEIVCHCERVTRAEITEALGGSIPARTIGGLRRRTRCMNGRCQGFYCTGRIVEIASPHIPALAGAAGGA